MPHLTTPAPELSFASAREIALRIRRREISAREMLAHCIARIEAHDGAINALPVRDVERAAARALAADEALARGADWGPLHGVPMTVKESFDVEGLPTTWGFEHRRGHVAAGNAVAVQRLLDAGAVIFAKSNVPVALADWQSFNPIYGTTSNPWDLGRTPGGSSGGSAAALAAGFTALELGSDIGASIRNPAHYCGVFGHKPTWGIVPSVGQQVAPTAREDGVDIAVCGPMARSAFDLTLALDLLCAPLEAASPLGRLPARWRDDGRTARQCRVAILFDDAQAEVDSAVQRPLRELADFLRREGVSVAEDVRPVDSAETNHVYLTLLRATTGARLAAAEYQRLAARRDTMDPAAPGYEARLVFGSTLSHREWVALDERRAALARRWAAFFESFDLLICPVATTEAFPHNQRGERWERMIDVNGRPQPTTDALFWAGYPGLCGLPATAVPLGLTPRGLPVGAQIVGPLFGDPVCLRFARWLEEAYRGFVPPPLR
jgi:amidase